MPTLHIDLRDGFKNDEVALSIDGKEAARLSNVTTNLAISYAASKDVPAPEGVCQLQIDLPNRGLSAQFEVDAAETPHITVFAHEGRLETRKFKEALPLM